MKYWYCIGLCACAFLTFSSCNKTGPTAPSQTIVSQSPKGETPSGTTNQSSGQSDELPAEDAHLADWPGELGPRIGDAPADLNDLNAVAQIYLRPLRAGSSILNQSWIASEIPADDLINIYAYNNLGNLPILLGVDGLTYNIGNGQPQVAADLVESSLLRHFDVTPDHLRTAIHYNADTHIYTLYDCFSASGRFVALSAEEKDGIITVKAGFAMTGEDIYTCGDLRLKLEEGTVKYLSFEADNS